MSSLYISTSYGYVFKPDGEEKQKLKEWENSESSCKLLKQYKENARENATPVISLIDDEMGRNFFFSAEDAYLDCLFGYTTFQMGDLSANPAVVESVAREFENMLLDPEVPEVFRVRESWKVAGTLFHVTT